MVKISATMMGCWECLPSFTVHINIERLLQLPDDLFLLRDERNDKFIVHKEYEYDLYADSKIGENR